MAVEQRFAASVSFPGQNSKLGHPALQTDPSRAAKRKVKGRQAAYRGFDHRHAVQRGKLEVVKRLVSLAHDIQASSLVRSGVQL